MFVSVFLHLFAGESGLRASSWEHGNTPGLYGPQPALYGPKPRLCWPKPALYGPTPGLYGPTPGLNGPTPARYGPKPALYGPTPGLCWPTTGLCTTWQYGRHVSHNASVVLECVPCQRCRCFVTLMNFGSLSARSFSCCVSSSVNRLYAVAAG